LPLIGHDSAEKVARAMSELRRWLRGRSMLGATDMRCYRRNTSHFELMSQQPDLVVVILLQLDLRLLELIDLVSNHLHLLDLVGYLALDLLRASALAVEFGSERLKELVETVVGSWLHPAMGIGSPDGVVHGECDSVARERQEMTGSTGEVWAVG
jgi:hypothetical protein